MSSPSERKERPILFSGEMVRAILDGRKTMTRRVMKPQASSKGVEIYARPDGRFVWTLCAGVAVSEPFRCPYGKPGDLLWVRETHRADELALRHDVVRYKADNACLPVDWESLEASDRWEHIYNYKAPKRWRPSVHMPRWASRITLEVTGVRVQRLLSISDRDVRAEGIQGDMYLEELGIETPDPRSAQAYFMELWDSLNAKRGYSWDSNPWVWIVEFKRIKKGGSDEFEGTGPTETNDG